MDVQKINKSTFYSDGLVQGWDSMIWTERHSSLGDFQMKTPRVGETMEVIPEGSLIAIRGSDEVCMVETHSIGKNDKGAAELTTVGRSLEGFLDNRVLTGPYKEPWSVPGQYTVQDALMMLIWNSIVNPTTAEVIRDYAWDHLPRDIIPNVSVTDSTKALKAVVGEGKQEDLQTVYDWWFETGSIYTKVQDLLTLGNLGLRIIRPSSTGAKVLSNVALAIPGNYGSDRILTKDAAAKVSTLRFDVYNGRNRTGSNPTDTPLDPQDQVTFSYKAGHIDKPQYLFSVKDMKNTIHMQSPFETVEIYEGQTGLDLYMEWVDAGEIDESLLALDYTQALTNKARAEWKRRKQVKFIDGGIPGSAPWKYGVDYYLGDLVTVMGEYKINETKMVSEYIRSADKNGEKAYPTLIDPP